MSARTWIGVMFCLLCASLCPASSDAGTPERVGGPCRYDTFPGNATIVSIAPAQTPNVMTPYPAQIVTYIFAPTAPISGEPLYTPGSLHTLTLVNGMLPGPQFLKKYGIASGQTIPCELHIIRQGACTPALYTFPGVDLTDYFETAQP